MSNFSPRRLADAIQIAASVGVIAGIVYLIVDLVHKRQPMEPGPTARVSVAATSETRPPHQSEQTAEITGERQSELRDFVTRNCPACHGVRLTGSIGPALSETDLQHLSVTAVTFTILHGYAGKGMPAWKAQLSETEAYWIAEQLKQGGFTR